MRKDQPNFPEQLKSEAAAQAEVLEFLKALPADGLEWTYFSPPALIEPGKRTGIVTLGLDALPYNSQGKSYISNEDFALATLDELESPKHIRRRFTAVSG
jgi:putative NADH-flavin reductase